MLWFAGEEGGWLAAGPVFVAGAVVGREGVAAGATRLVVDAFRFTPGGDDHTQRGTVAGAGDVRHAAVSGLVDRGKVEPIRHEVG